MIYYSEDKINDWNYGADNLIKVYRDGYVAYYKVISGSSSGQTPCYAVVDDIEEYSSLEFVDVFDKATSKWYKLNNLNEFEEYGVYGQGRDIPYYDGKLTVDSGYEYMYSGSSWVNVGAVSGGEIPDSTVIEFEDANVKALCVNAWGGNVVAGEITYGEAKQVTSLGTVFKGQTSIRKFNEFCYFTGMQSVDHADFSGCTNLNEIVIPTSVRTIGVFDATQRDRIPFSGCPNLSAITYLPSSQSIAISQTARESEYYRQRQSNSGTPMVFPDREIIAVSGILAWKTYMSNVYFQSPNLPIDKEVMIANLESEPYNCKNIYCPIGSYQTYYDFFGQYPGRTVTEYDFETDPNNVLAKVRTWSGKTIGDVVYPVDYTIKQQPPIVEYFQTVAEMEAYECPYVGLIGYVSTDRYVFADNYEWVMRQQVPCYAVADDISQYSSTEFEDVFDKTSDKWYKLNNLNEFEEYGVYGEGRNISYYEGKLTIDGDYEYIYSGSSWVNVGETSGTTVTIQSPEYLQKDADHKGAIMSDKKFGQNSKIQVKLQPTNANGGALLGDYGTSDNNDIRFFFAGSNAYWDLINKRLNPRLYTGTTYELELGNHYIKNLSTSTMITSGTSVTFAERDCALNVFGGGVTAECNPQASGDYGLLYYFKLYDGETLVLDMIPYVDNVGYGLFDKVSMTKYPQSTLHASLTASSNVQTITITGGAAYPMYYDEKQDPPSEVTFATMDEALAYECPYVGLEATIGGDPYVFNAQYQWVPVT